jgi:hypothetical protein
MIKNFLRLGIVLAFLAGLAQPAVASQGSGCMPTSGTVSGLTLVQDINAANAAFISMNSGATAPATDCSGLAVYGQTWLDTINSQIKFFDGTSWLKFGTVDASNHIWKPVIGGGLDSITSNTTTDLCSVPGSVITVISNTTITGFGTSCSPGNIKLVKFATALTLTNSATLVLPGGQDIQTAAGDYLMAVYLGSGTWGVPSYTPASGAAVKNPAVDPCTIAYFAGGTPPTKWALGFGQALTRTSFPDYLACATRVQAGTRSSGNPTISGLSDVSGFGVGMPIEGVGIQAGTTITAIPSTSSVTMSLNATSSGTADVTVFFTGYGSGGSSTTVGVPDCRGRTLAGPDNMGGTSANRLTSAFFGTAATALNAAGGNQSKSLSTPELPPYTPSGSITNGAITSTVNSTNPSSIVSIPGCCAFLNGNIAGSQLLSQALTVTSTQAASTFTGTPQGGVNNAFSILQPTLIANCMIRVSP